jgi:hypothetical protein
MSGGDCGIKIAFEVPYPWFVKLSESLDLIVV